MKRTFAAFGRIAVAAALLPILSSCSQAPQNADGAPPSQSKADNSTPNKEREAWDVIYMQGKRIGYCHSTARLVKEADKEVMRTEAAAHLSLRRGADTVQQDITSLSIETPGGKLLRFESDIGMGPTNIHTKGQVKGDRLEIQTTGAAAAPVETSIPWPGDVAGPFAVDQSLTSKPMQPGERRTLKAFVAEFQQVVEIDLIAKNFEPCKLLTGTHDLLRIETVMRMSNGQKLEQTVWTDRTGETLKSLMPAMGMLETYRVSKAEALQKADAAQLDLLSSMMVKVDTPLANSLRTKEVRYRVHLDGGDPAGIFLAGPSQAVKSIDANTADVTIYAIRPGQPGGNAAAPADPPTDDDLRPNLLVQSDDPLIVADAKRAAGDEKDPWRVAVALERYVNREVKKKNYSQAFLSAAEVAKSLEGDCTEHSVFLIALCRARGIPARAAVGLVYLPSQQAFFYHMWTEVYVDKRWIPIDGTLALGGIGADHLKVAQTNLKNVSAWNAFLPVAQIMGRLTIKITAQK
jgi:hypothetical protein